MKQKFLTAFIVFAVSYALLYWGLGMAVEQFADSYAASAQHPGRVDEVSLDALRILFVMPVSGCAALFFAALVWRRMGKK